MMFVENEISGNSTNLAYFANAQSVNGSNRFFRNIASADTYGPVVDMVNENASDDQPVLSIRQDSTNYPAVEVTGYINQDGIFAEIHVHDGSTAQSIPTGTTYTKSTAFVDNGESSNCTADATNDKITITKTGRYLVSGQVSFSSGTANVTWFGTVFLNGVEQDKVHFTDKVGAAGDIDSASFTGIIDVTTANWDLDMRVRHDNGGSVNLTISYANLNVTYLGET